MSVQALSWVFDRSAVGGNHRLVLLSLANHAGEDGSSAYPSVETISRETQLSERAVQRCLRKLERDGRIECLGWAPDIRIRSDRRPRLYRILMTDDAASREWVKGDDDLDGVTVLSPRPRGDASGTPSEHGVPDLVSRGATSGSHGVTLVAPEPSLNRPEPSCAPAGARATKDATVTAIDAGTYSTAFEAFWSAYPRKRGKKAAWSKWRATRRADRASNADLIAAAHRYADDVTDRGTPPQFVMLGQTFLGPQEHWRDFLPDAATGRAVIDDERHAPVKLARYEDA